jgi:hypothetical protein
MEREKNGMEGSVTNGIRLVVPVSQLALHQQYTYDTYIRKASPYECLWTSDDGNKRCCSDTRSCGSISYQTYILEARNHIPNSTT